MSKAKLIELIKGNQEDVYDFFAETPTYEVQNILRQALKDQDRDTRHGCANAVSKMDDHARIDTSLGTSAGVILKGKAHNSCINYQDKDLEGL